MTVTCLTLLILYSALILGWLIYIWFTTRKR